MRWGVLFVIPFKYFICHVTALLTFYMQTFILLVILYLTYSPPSVLTSSQIISLLSLVISFSRNCSKVNAAHLFSLIAFLSIKIGNSIWYDKSFFETHRAIESAFRFGRRI